MIKAKGNIAGKEVLIIGLSYANVDRLRADGLDGYILVRGEEVGLPHDIMITCGTTEAEIATKFSKYIGPHTKVHVDKRLKS